MSDGTQLIADVFRPNSLEPVPVLVYGPEGAIRVCWLPDPTRPIRGPTWLWVHGSTMTRAIGDLDFGPQAAIDYDTLIQDFFDHYLKDMGNSFSRSPRVRQFVM